MCSVLGMRSQWDLWEIQVNTPRGRAAEGELCQGYKFMCNQDMDGIDEMSVL